MVWRAFGELNPLQSDRCGLGPGDLEEVMIATVGVEVCEGGV